MDLKTCSQTQLDILVHELDKARDELSMLSNAVLGGVARMAVDEDLRIVHASEGYYRMTGYTQEESMQAPFLGKGLNLILPQDVPHVIASLKVLLEKNQPASVSYRILKKNGTVAWNSAYTACLKEGEEGRYIDVFFMDTSENKLLETKLTSLLGQMPGGVVQMRIGKELEILYANEEFYRQTEYSREEFHESALHDYYLAIVHPLDREALIEKARQAVEANSTWSSIVYRIITKSGQQKWMSLRASRINDINEQEGMIQCTISDVSVIKEHEKQIALNEERFRILSEQTGDTVYDWDIITDTVHCSAIFEKMFGYTMPKDFSVSKLLTYDFIHELDKPIVQELFNKIKSGVPYVEADVRARRYDGEYFWCRHRATTIFDDAHHPIRVIGMMSDVDDYKQNTFALQNKAMCDSLTGLYNRMAAEREINHCLQTHKHGVHAFMQFDIDHFKQINDFMGHSAGDDVLVKIAEHVSSIFRDCDITARMGGDEFAVFVSNIPTSEVANVKAEQLRSAVCCDFAYKEKIYPLSISIGMAVYPHHGVTFQELYEHADYALYMAKKAGGNRYLSFADKTQIEE